MEFIGWFLFLFAAARLTSAEVFTAISDMETLLHTERALTFNLMNFIKAEEERIQELKRYSLKCSLIVINSTNKISKQRNNFINLICLVDCEVY